MPGFESMTGITGIEYIGGARMEGLAYCQEKGNELIEHYLATWHPHWCGP